MHGAPNACHRLSPPWTCNVFYPFIKQNKILCSERFYTLPLAVYTGILPVYTIRPLKKKKRIATVFVHAVFLCTELLFLLLIFCFALFLIYTHHSYRSNNNKNNSNNAISYIRAIQYHRRIHGELLYDISLARGVARPRGDTRKPLLTVTNEHHNNKALKSSSVEQ